MSSRESRVSDATPLRIVLLGKSVPENSRVGNFILGRSAFDSEAPPDVVERVGGRLKHRRVILINSPQLLHTNISDHQITQTARECVSLSDPGPHVVLLLLQHEQCSAEDQERVEKLLDSFSERLLQHSMVLSTQEPTETNEILQKIIHKCSNRHFSLQRSSSPDDLLQALEDIEQSNEGRHLHYAQYEAFSEEKQRYGERLNVVVCGSDGSLKSSILELIQQQTHRRSESVRTDVDLLLNVLELPALFNTGLSEEEVMRQTLHCVSLCHPGVHAFLLIIPDAPLNNQDRAEMEEIKRIFSSRINKHLMILIKQNSEHQTAELNEETQAVIESFGGRHHFCGPKTQVSTLMENIEQMLEENRGGFFSTETFLEAQMEKLMKYKEMKKMSSLETSLLTKVPRENTDDEVRIVLLGKTGVGKSATGNTILGRAAFTAETSHQPVTKVSQRESGEISGRQVTVIDTPGLFDTELTNEEIQTELSNCISMILPGPHVFLLLIPVGRFTKEEETSVKIIQETFGENSLMFTMVLFTRGNDLENKTIEEYLGRPGSPLMNLIEACGNRFHVFNNNQTEDRTQVSDLLEKIDNMVKANGGSFYSCKMFREMEGERQEQQMKILIDRPREAEEEMKKLEDKDRMKMMMEEEQQMHETEKKRGEEELKREIRDEEKHQSEILDEMERERETFKLKEEEKKRREEEDEKRREKEQREFNERMKEEREIMEREKEDLQSKNKEEENKMKMMEKLNREREELMKKHEGEKEKIMMEEEQHKQTTLVSQSTGEETLESNPLKRKIPEYVEADTRVSSLPSRRIVLLGKTGFGKSAAGNTILGQREFSSVMSTNSVTSVCSEAQATVSGRSVSVVDTPGIFETQRKPEELMKEISRSVHLSSPGPHAFLIVFHVDMRFTEQDQQILQLMEMWFGEEVLKYSIILFTHGDLLEGETVEELIQENCRVRALVQQCGGRYQLFNNEDLNNREQVNDLLQKIDSMIQQNGGGHYTNQMYEDAQRQQVEEERKQQEEMERVRKETEEKTIAECADQYKSELQKLNLERKREKEKRKQESNREVMGHQWRKQEEKQNCVCS